MKMPQTKTIMYLLLIFSLTGLLSAVYLTDLHYQSQSSDTICDINSTVSCTNLAQSKYSLFFGIPIAVLGILGYLSFLGITIALFFRPKLNLLKKVLLALSSLALIFTIYLVFIELKVGIFCLGCLVSQGSTTATFILSYLLYKRTISQQDS